MNEMSNTRILLVCFFALFGVTALAGEPVKLILVTSITSDSEQGDVIQLVGKQAPECRYFGKLMHKPQSQATTKDKFVALLTGNVGEWWISIDGEACKRAAKAQVQQVLLQVPLIPVARYPAGTEVTASFVTRK